MKPSKKKIRWGLFGSPTIEPPFIELAMDGVSWNCRTLCLKVSLNLFGSWPRCFLHHLNNPSLQSSIKFSLAVTAREVGYSAMGLKISDNIAYSGHRNIKVSGNGLVALRLSMLGNNLESDLLKQFSGFLYFLQAHTVTQSSRMTPVFNPNWLNEWFLYCRHLQLTTDEFISKVKENHLIEI